jgi:hypothetical protein
LACHRWWNDLARLQQATKALLDGLELHFHALDGPAFRLVHNFRVSASMKGALTNSLLLTRFNPTW